jgi:hypothetical protein
MLDFAFWIMIAYAILVIGLITFLNWYYDKRNRYPGRMPNQYEVKEPDALRNIRRNFWS